MRFCASKSTSRASMTASHLERRAIVSKTTRGGASRCTSKRTTRLQTWTIEFSPDGLPGCDEHPCARDAAARAGDESSTIVGRARAQAAADRKGKERRLHGHGGEQQSAEKELFPK